jgi:hypothetical protein
MPIRQAFRHRVGRHGLARARRPVEEHDEPAAVGHHVVEPPVLAQAQVSIMVPQHGQDAALVLAGQDYAVQVRERGLDPAEPEEVVVQAGPSDHVVERVGRQTHRGAQDLVGPQRAPVHAHADHIVPHQPTLGAERGPQRDHILERHVREPEGHLRAERRAPEAGLRGFGKQVVEPARKAGRHGQEQHCAFELVEPGEIRKAVERGRSAGGSPSGQAPIDA